MIIVNIASVSSIQCALVTAIFKIKSHVSVIIDSENIVFSFAAAASMVIAIASEWCNSFPLTPIFPPTIFSIVTIAYFACDLPAC